MKIAVYPGSFDPITLGHIDVLRDGAQMFDKVIITVSNNISKTSLLSVEERLQLIKESIKEFNNVEVDCFNGLTVEYAKSKNATILLRGLRAVSDFEYEMQMALFNKDLCNELETVFFIADAEHSFISSSQVRNIASLGGSVEKYVTAPVAAALAEKYETR